jgi:spore maturation protein B
MSAVKKIAVYDGFIEGAKDAAILCFKLLPYMASVFILIEVFEASGINNFISKYLGAFFGFFGIPEELSELIVLRPLSGSGSLGALEKVLDTYGADSYIGRCASVICGANDTVLYIVAAYTSECKDKSTGPAVPIAVFASFVGIVVSCFICRFI